MRLNQKLSEKQVLIINYIENYVNENGWLIEPCFGFIPIAWFFLFICTLIFVIKVIIIIFQFLKK